ncbi:hypothetical protein V5799_031291 [Amblyomma americanum]|uniref:Uncharacterized protein n=1 Tax=Amblyomma americanum TaxID=6943 RepID=A0AAQ4EL16_AMBAM
MSKRCCLGPSFFFGGGGYVGKITLSSLNSHKENMSQAPDRTHAVRTCGASAKKYSCRPVLTAHGCLHDTTGLAKQVAEILHLFHCALLLGPRQKSQHPHDTQLLHTFQSQKMGNLPKKCHRWSPLQQNEKKMSNGLVLIY